MRSFLSISLLFCFSLCGFAQKQIALQHIKQLKDSGVVLVRLKTSELTIKALDSLGKTEEADRRREAQARLNKDIAQAFKLIYRFSDPVYFFYSQHSQAIAGGDFEGILMNDELQVDSTIHIGDQSVYIMEFGRTQGLAIPALVIMDQNFKQLEPPFPYFSRTFEGVPLLKRVPGKTVEILNRKLRDYYSFHY